MKFWILSVILFCCSIFGLSHHTKPKDFEPIARTPLGFLKGISVEIRGVRVYQFLGIPYAEPPLNALRFKRPVPKKPWNGVIHVDEWDVACQQPRIKGVNDDLDLNENCLVLNVFATEACFKEQINENKLRPVMVYVHGGFFAFGSANIRSSYDGSVMAALKDVVIVTVNYRLGPLGFLHLPEAGVPGNMGLWDIQMALKWVKDNIEHFGGDPDRVTIFGESAGSIAVSAQLVSPQSKGLFKNAIMQSGSIYGIKRFTTPNVTAKFLNKINCTSNDYKSCLANYQYGQFPEADGLTFWPISGDRFLPYSPEVIVANDGVDPNVNVLLGTVGNEGIFFLLWDYYKYFNPSNPVNMTIPYAKYIFGQLFGEKLIDYYSERYLNSVSADDPDAIRLAIAQALGDNVVTCSTYAFGRDLVRNGVSNVYGYVQTQKPTYGLVGQTGWNAGLPTHADDIAPIFGRPFVKPETYNVEDAFLSHLMMDIWTKFAKDNKPPKVSHQDWFTWGSNSKVPYYAMVLDSKKLGKIETKRVDFCLKNWPLPLDIPLGLEPKNLTMPL